MKKITLVALTVLVLGAGCESTQQILGGLPTGTETNTAQIAAGLKEALSVKLEIKERNTLLCYLDFFIAHLKHFVRGCIS